MRGKGSMQAGLCVCVSHSCPRSVPRSCSSLVPHQQTHTGVQATPHRSRFSTQRVRCSQKAPQARQEGPRQHSGLRALYVVCPVVW